MPAQATTDLLTETPNAVEPTAEALTALAQWSASSTADLFNPKRRKLSRSLYLLPEIPRTGNGLGPEVSLEDFSGKLLVVTLGITDVVERTGLTVSVWGSSDQADWGTKPLVTFRERQYCGVYSVLLNLATRPDIQYLRVHWKMNRWGRGERPPSFGFEVFLEESGARVSGSALS